jgi:hypothetical protein
VYYKDFAVDKALWTQALNSSLDGFAKVFGESLPLGVTQDDAEFASQLMTGFRHLDSVLGE